MDHGSIKPWTRGTKGNCSRNRQFRGRSCKPICKPDAARQAETRETNTTAVAGASCVKLLLDENVPAPITSAVKTLLRRSHDVQHVIDMPGWSGTKDLHLYRKAKDAGFEVARVRRMAAITATGTSSTDSSVSPDVKSFPAAH
ncbi:MAG TPA: hypothetical protein VFO01_08400 [Trebonia sp.]|nr:hypothetical protein [Trebonia sp.]